MRGFAAPLLLILVVSILFGGYFFLNNSKPNLITPNFQKETIPTYTNDKLMFSFQYDKDLVVKEDTESEFNQRTAGPTSKSAVGDYRKNFKGYIGYEPEDFTAGVVVLEKNESYDQNPLTLWIFDNPEELSVDDWYQNYWYYPFVWGDFTSMGKITLAPKTEATISGQIGKSGVVDFQPGKPKFVYLSNNGKMYLFRIMGEKGDRILSTFKFSPSQLSEEKCVIGGCSSQLCLQVIEGQEDQTVSTCEYKEEYGCYKTAKCEKQRDGKCGWTKTEELNKCFREANALF